VLKIIKLAHPRKLNPSHGIITTVENTVIPNKIRNNEHIAQIIPQHSTFNLILTNIRYLSQKSLKILTTQLNCDLYQYVVDL
jgi:hypothetical protein